MGRLSALLTVALAALCIGSCSKDVADTPLEAAEAQPTNTPARPSEEATAIWMMTSLPIVWGEAQGMDAILSGGAGPSPLYAHWQRLYDLTPVDSLDGLGESDVDLVLMVQPRAMAPADLADLDQWVRAGGRALILTDPDLAFPSALPLGNPGRPLATGLLSPLLSHWGLELEFREEGFPSPDGLTPVRSGTFHRTTDTPANCTVGPRRFVADCRLGAGRAVLLADADFPFAGNETERARSRQYIDRLIAALATEDSPAELPIP